jgi:hypothetical protein
MVDRDVWKRRRLLPMGLALRVRLHGLNIASHIEISTAGVRDYCHIKVCKFYHRLDANIG